MTQQKSNVVRLPPRIVEHGDGRATIAGRTADQCADEARRLREEADELRRFVAERAAKRVAKGSP